MEEVEKIEVKTGLSETIELYLPPHYEGEVEYIEADNWLLTYLLSRRYMRLESLIKSKPQNALRKLRRLGKSVIKMFAGEFETTIYEWPSNTGYSKMLVFTDPVGNFFALLPDKKVLISLPLHFVCSYYP